MGDGTVRYPSAAGGVRVGTRKPVSAAKRAAPPRPSAATYWRRRFIVLVICLAAIAASAWSLSNAFKVQPRASGATTTGDRSSVGTAQHRGGSAGHRGGAARNGAGHGGAPLPAGSSHGPSGSPNASQGGRTTSPESSPSPSPSPSASLGSIPKFCPRQSVVISLAQVKVAAGRRPTFNVSVVSTQRADCSFNIGPGHLALVIRKGRTRVWSSADCVTGNGGPVTTL